MSTPVKTTTASEAPVTDSPGTWRHPRLDEITRRRNATTFTEKNVRQIAYGAVGLVSIWLLRAISKLRYVPNIVPASAQPYLEWAWTLVQIIPLLNIISACLPLLRRQDDLADIPLTPAQRKLLGLPPSSAAPIPDAQYSTPPRYSRTPSIAGSVGSRGSYTSSPLSGRGSPALQGGGSPYSPMGSPLANKGLDFSVNGRRSSFGSQSPFAASTSTNLFSDPGSPSPSGGKRTSVGLNSKWLYERGRRTSGSTWMH
ncbi:Meiotically up-regulated gene 31 protein-like protein [Hapsidospora chrysogenum ATCC 11550]|uniref:Meiotically up-regulated gene 31 protein-like protein n=1 Tax=Hapsidospora chrysogenum (strain ATCC 11550 / CBS 779.69 / DSM 880 / IAM 14645 / JCM 23072 / IMI 49137) TaxID=857340 RepID=A0A086TE85_HAPC1|nr:Meiotically up-regulated gene 31 protein-like protein [Hapsidospora chrysogenum ATCC 11550]